MTTSAPASRCREEELTAQVRLIAQVADAGISNAAQDRDQMAKQLSRQDVAGLMDDTFLRPALAETRAALDSDRADSDRALETVKKAVEQWNGDLGSLNRSPPDRCRTHSGLRAPRVTAGGRRS